jgi:hypothetical protein
LCAVCDTNVLNEFLLAWSDRDYAYAIIGLEDFHEDE